MEKISGLKSELKKLRHVIEELETQRKCLNEELQSSKELVEMFHQLLDTARHGMYIEEVTQSSMLYVNPAYAELFGTTQEEMVTNPKSWINPIHPDDLQRIIENTRKVTEQQDWEFLVDSYRIVGPDGTARWVRDVTVPIRDSQGNLIRSAGIIEDITLRKQAEDNLLEWTRKIELLHEVTRQMAVQTSEKFVYLLAIESVKTIFGLNNCHIGVLEEGVVTTKAASASTDTMEELFLNLSPQIIEKLFKKNETIIIDSASHLWNCQIEEQGFKTLIVTPINSTGIFQVVSSNTGPFNPNLIRMLELLLGHTSEAVNRIRLQENLKHQALHDPLTGVFNRYYLNIYLRSEMKRSERYNRKIGFMMIDIDRFKEINDRFGHLIGDKVLTEIATEIQQCVRESDIVIRYGGDEFLAILPETNGEVEFVRKRIIETIPRNQEIQELVGFPVTISIGTAHWDPNGSESLETILTRSDRKMYEEKRRKEL
ncbi:diguanylate cyclase [bacterium]|nr:diguanylate cyclase [bacterium]